MPYSHTPVSITTQLWDFDQHAIPNWHVACNSPKQSTDSKCPTWLLQCTCNAHLKKIYTYAFFETYVRDLYLAYVVLCCYSDHGIFFRFDYVGFGCVGVNSMVSCCLFMFLSVLNMWFWSMLLMIHVVMLWIHVIRFRYEVFEYDINSYHCSLEICGFWVCWY